LAEYYCDGQAGAPVVVLLGSLGTTGAVWEAQLLALRPWLAVMRVEHPGHGGAVAAPPGTGSVAALGQRVLDLMDEAGVARAHIAGLSLGGLIAMWLAAHHPSRVNHLVVSCSTGRFGSPETYLQRAAAVRADGTAPLVAGALSRWFTPPFAARQADLVAAFAKDLAEVSRDGYAYCCEAVAGADLSPDMDRIEAPTLVIGGGLDPVVPPLLVAETASKIPGAGLVVVPESAHLVNVEQPGAFNDALLGHLVGSPVARGLRVRREVLGDAHVERALARQTSLSAGFQDLLNRWPWGEVWARPGLERRTRRLLVIAMLAALGHHHELEMHVRAARRDGTTDRELEEVLLMTAVYAGVPAANAAFAIADRVVGERCEPSETPAGPGLSLPDRDAPGPQ